MNMMFLNQPSNKLSIKPDRLHISYFNCYNTIRGLKSGEKLAINFNKILEISATCTHCLTPPLITVQLHAFYTVTCPRML